MAPSFDNISGESFGKLNVAEGKIMPIMVVGMSFRRPKDATSVEIFER
jgi:hypothetical protein